MTHPFIEDLIRSGRLTDEQAQAWFEYNQAGGALNPFEWVDAGEPSVSEEKAANAWLNRLGTYLMSQMEQGFIEEPEADVIWEDMVSRLTGQGKYEGVRETVAELSGSVVTAVKSYWASLPVAAQKAAEKEARETQQREENIASQLGKLPLRARGTPEEQIIAGQNAIRQLQIQRPTAPNYIQNIIDSQINQLQEGIAQLGKVARGRARERTVAAEGMESISDRLAREAEETKAEPGMIARDFAEKYGMAPEAAQRTGQRYQTSPESEEFANLTKEQERELAWVGMEEEEKSQPMTRRAPLEPIEPPGFGQIGVTGSPAWKSWFEQNYPSIAKQFRGKPAEERTAEGWTKFLESERARLKEEFATWSPYQRGERPGAFQPRIKTVAF